MALFGDERCLDCGSEPEMYLADERVWREAGLRPFDECCLADLSKRLGRPLRREDVLVANFSQQTSFFDDDLNAFVAPSA